jgi:hypothetical protein
MSAESRVDLEIARIALRHLPRTFFAEMRMLLASAAVLLPVAAPAGVVRERSEERLYFARGSLHLWVHGNAMTSPSKTRWLEKAREVVENARALLAGANLSGKELRCAGHRLVESAP